MPDILTPEEKHLIAEAVASGRVRRIPRGVSGAAHISRWPAGRAARMRISRRQARFARAAATSAARATGATTAKTPTPPKGPF